MPETFAFAPQSPLQRHSGKQASGPRAGTVGGQSVGRVISASPQTDTTGQSSIPAYLEDLFAPQLQARQQQKFFEGALAAHSQEAMNDIAESQPAWSKVFGPSAYEQGAAFYHGQQSVSKFFADKIANMDQLVQMPQEEVSRMLIEDSKALHTDSQAANLVIQKTFLDQSGQFMDQYVKGRMAFQQRVAKEAQFTAWGDAAAVADVQLKSYALMGDQGSVENLSMQQQFVSAFAQPPGQTDESYRDNLYSSARNMIQNKQFRAYALFRNSDHFARLDPDKQNQLDAAQDRYEKLANDEAAFGAADQIVALDAQLTQFEVFQNMDEADQKAMLAKGYKPPNPRELMEGRMAVNRAISLEAGTSTPYFSADEVRGVGTKLIDVIGSANIRRINQVRADQQRAQDRQAQLELKDYEAQLKARQLGLAVQTGTVAQGLLNGSFDKDQWDIASRNMFVAGDVQSLARSYGQGVPLDAVGNLARQKIKASEGKGYTNSFHDDLQRFAAVKEVSNGMAIEIYGDYYEEMSNAADLLAQGESPEAAFDKSLGPKSKSDQAIFSTLPYKRADAIGKTVDKALVNLTPSVFGFRQGAPLSEASRFNVHSEVMNMLALRFKGREPTEVEVKATLDSMVNTGRIAAYGQYAWVQYGSNPAPLHTLIGADPQTTAVLLPKAINKAFGPALANKHPENHIAEIYRRDVNGRTVLSVVYADPETGDHHFADIAADELRAQRKSVDTKAVEANINSRNLWLPDGP